MVLGNIGFGANPARVGLIQALGAMAKTFALLGFMLAFSFPARACIFYTPAPNEILKENENVLIAYPIGISNLPKAADDPSYRRSFRQTILWKVVVGWKGKYQPGDQFTTRLNLDRSGMCSLGAGNYSDKPLLLAFSGQEPYADFWDFSAERNADMFRYFQKVRVKDGT